ncbi:MAG: hypothetical protein Q7U47_14820 [Paludibacter sp.]|nr:hypothetical protein [Paludibacter sp.]
MQNLKEHTANEQTPIAELYTNNYDHAGRLLKTKYKINDKPEVILNDMTASGSYDELGRLRIKKRHNGTDTEEYDYNIRNWTTRLKSGTFEEELYYNAGLPIGTNACYNGNIAYSSWLYNGDKNGYAYKYDELNRLTWAQSYFNNQIMPDGDYDEYFSFDKHGNIISLGRMKDANPIDHLMPMIYNGNQIQSIYDEFGGGFQYNTKEYNDNEKCPEIEFTYDPNGNMISDFDRNIVTIKYNLLNLPDIVQFGNGNQIINKYDAGGQKLSTRYKTLSYLLPQPLNPGEILSGAVDVNADETVIVEGTDYLGNIEYKVIRTFDYDVTELPVDSRFVERICNPEGYLTHHLTTTYGPIYNYYRKDHLGNNREVWQAAYLRNGTLRNASTTQRTQYYPSGLPWASNSGDNPSAQNKKFNGCEFIEMHGLDVTDLGNRGVHNAKNRFDTMDRFCEKFPWQSPYVHAGNNPVNYVDVMGDSVAVLLYPGTVGHMAMLIQNDNGKWSYYSVNGDDLYKLTNGLLGNKNFDEIKKGEFDSPADFLKNEFNQLSDKENDNEKANYKFTDAYILPTTKEQDKSMSDTFEKISNEKYDVFTNNCAHAVQRTISSVGFGVNEKTYQPTGMYGTTSTYSMIESTPMRPNTAFSVIKQNNPQGTHIKLRIK